jgi:hypothetical protein
MNRLSLGEVSILLLGQLQSDPAAHCLDGPLNCLSPFQVHAIPSTLRHLEKLGGVLKRQFPGRGVLRSSSRNWQDQRFESMKHM